VISCQERCIWVRNILPISFSLSLTSFTPTFRDWQRHGDPSPCQAIILACGQHISPSLLISLLLPLVLLPRQLTFTCIPATAPLVAGMGGLTAHCSSFTCLCYFKMAELTLLHQTLCHSPSNFHASTPILKATCNPRISIATCPQLKKRAKRPTSVA
jgi:hypothetical protein